MTYQEKIALLNALSGILLATKDITTINSVNKKIQDLIASL